MKPPDSAGAPGMPLENRCVVPSCDVYTSRPDLTAYAADGSPPASVLSTNAGGVNRSEAACAPVVDTAADVNTASIKHARYEPAPASRAPQLEWDTAFLPSRPTRSARTGR